jgi:CheY-like chemotaxis protein
VLVVDDNVDAAESLAMVLRMHGHDVHTMHDGHSVLAAAQKELPEIAILDIGLPQMDGYEVARRLRDLPGGDQVVLIALTGYGQAEDKQRAQEAGFDHHLVKPIEPDVLETLLARAADR